MESIPVEVFYKCIFPSLEYGDLLRLRRVSKSIKSFSDEFLRNNFKNKVREIDKIHGFQFFLQSDLSTTSIIINCNCGPNLFENPETAQFLRLHGDKITHGTIDLLESFMSDSEFQFFSNLPNLQHLEIHFIDASQRDCSYAYKKVNRVKTFREKPRFPQNFKNLKTLKLGGIQGSKVGDHGYGFDLLQFCENLEYFKHTHLDFNIPTPSKHADGCLGYVMDYIKRRSRRMRGLPNLQYYDLQNVHITRRQHLTHYYAGSFCKLVDLCHKNQVKLLNVPAQLLEGAPTMFTSPTIVSMKEVHRAIFFAELPNLEKLVIRSLQRSSAWPTGLAREAPEWPSLKSLDFKIDSYLLSGDTRTDLFLAFLFDPEKKREGLRDLAIRFDTTFWEDRDVDEDDEEDRDVDEDDEEDRDVDEDDEEDRDVDEDDEEDRDVDEDDDSSIPVPSSLNVAVACPFLTKLTLENWAGTDEQVTGFWEGLNLLEEVKLKKCEKLGDAAFVGELGTENPVFLKLNKLKQLSLEGLDDMPGITDKSFEVVFSRLKIKRFYLTSDGPLESISKSGIESLLFGDFNKCVEKFPFDDWSLDGVSEEAFAQLKLKFRASHML